MSPAAPARMQTPILEPPLRGALKPRSKIQPPARWPGIDFRELWKFRELFLFLVWRDVKVRYKQTLLGVAWAVLQPAMMMVVFTVFFKGLADIGTGDLPPPLFYLSGLLPWFFFQQSVNAAGASVVGSEHLITKIYFPRLIIPFSTVLAALFDSLMALCLLAVMSMFYQRPPGANFFMLPVVYFVIAMLAAGVGTIIAALNVVYRDVRYIVPFALQLGIFATPTIYMIPKKHSGEKLYLLHELNPMTGLVQAYRSAVVGGPMPWEELGIATLAAMVIFTLGAFYFRKTEDRFADII